MARSAIAASSKTPILLRPVMVIYFLLFNEAVFGKKNTSLLFLVGVETHLSCKSATHSHFPRPYRRIVGPSRQMPGCKGDDLRNSRAADCPTYVAPPFLRVHQSPPDPSNCRKHFLDQTAGRASPAAPAPCAGSLAPSLVDYWDRHHTLAASVGQIAHADYRASAQSAAGRPAAACPQAR